MVLEAVKGSAAGQGGSGRGLLRALWERRWVPRDRPGALASSELAVPRGLLRAPAAQPLELLLRAYRRHLRERLEAAHRGEVSRGFRPLPALVGRHWAPRHERLAQLRVPRRVRRVPAPPARRQRRVARRARRAAARAGRRPDPDPLGQQRRIVHAQLEVAVRVGARGGIHRGQPVPSHPPPGGRDAPRTEPRRRHPRAPPWPTCRPWSEAAQGRDPWTCATRPSCRCSRRPPRAIRPSGSCRSAMWTLPAT